MKGVLILMLALGFCATADSVASGQSTIQWRYRPSPFGTNPLYETVITGQGFHMDNYAQWRYGRGADAYTVSSDSSGWRIKYLSGKTYRVVTVDWLDVAYYHGQQRFGHSRLLNWGVYRVNNSSSGWKGAYVVRNR